VKLLLKQCILLSIYFVFISPSLLISQNLDCFDDDNEIVSLAAMWNPSVTGCSDAVPYFISVGYPCNTDLSVLGMTGTIEDICECTCQEFVECEDDDAIIASAFSTLSTCDETVQYLVNNYGYTQYDACQWDGNMGSGPLFAGQMIYEFCECTCAYIEPPQEIITVVDIIVDSEDHNILESAVIAAELADDLSGDGPFTVFAPTDDAFDALPAGTVEYLLEDPTGDLANILLHHVYSGSAMSTDLSDGMMIPTLLGTDLNISIDMEGTVLIDNAMVTVANIEADNGVVHIINTVLLPNEDEDCEDDDNTIESYFGNFFVTECSALINYLESNYSYSLEQSCSWDGAPMLDLNGLLISDICECSCELANTILIDYGMPKKLLFMIDIYGRLITEPVSHQNLFLIYDNGSIEKQIFIK